MGSRPCSQKRPCMAVRERRATTASTPIANPAERAMLLKGDPNVVTIDALYPICEMLCCSYRIWLKRLSTSDCPG